MGYGQLIRSIRKERGMTQEQFAKQCGMATITIRQYENEKRTPSFEQLLRISSAVNLTISEFLQLRPVVDTPENRETLDASIYAMLQAGDAFRADYLKKELSTLFNQLNLDGKEEAVKAVRLIADNPDYLSIVDDNDFDKIFSITKENPPEGQETASDGQDEEG